MRHGTRKGNLGAVLFTYLVIMALCAVVGGFIWPYVINTWLIFFGKAATCMFYHGWLLGFVPYLLGMGITLAIFTFVFFCFV